MIFIIATALAFAGATYEMVVYNRYQKYWRHEVENSVYLDLRQCKRFNVEYYESGSLIIAADTLLASKGGDGYDQHHYSLLNPLGSRTITLTRKKGNSPPGWFDITGVS